VHCLCICLYTQFEILQTISCLRALHALGPCACLFAPLLDGPFCKKAPGGRSERRPGLSSHEATTAARAPRHEGTMMPTL
jgi:hypothetical protein